MDSLLLPSRVRATGGTRYSPMAMSLPCLFCDNGRRPTGLTARKRGAKVGPRMEEANALASYGTQSRARAPPSAPPPPTPHVPRTTPVHGGLGAALYPPLSPGLQPQLLHGEAHGEDPAVTSANTWSRCQTRMKPRAPLVTGLKMGHDRLGQGCL